MSGIQTEESLLRKQSIRVDNLTGRVKKQGGRDPPVLFHAHASRSSGPQACCRSKTVWSNKSDRTCCFAKATIAQVRPQPRQQGRG